ncbi:hypothetical protein UlMin_031893 [Ulmus minor]
MVSLRRRKLLGLCTGTVDSFLSPNSKLSGNGITAENFTPTNTSPISVRPLRFDDSEQAEKNVVIGGSGSSNGSGIGSSNMPKEENQQLSGPPIKRRKRHRRKHLQSQEPFMRGVYFKNMKWQAAIKVDKKQIHLGTVATQEEAARLYDRAAYMCGREPNSELPETVKEELNKFQWDEFLAMTRSAITSKKNRRRIGAESQKMSESSPSSKNRNWENKLEDEDNDEEEENIEGEGNDSASDQDVDPDVSDG